MDNNTNDIESENDKVKEEWIKIQDELRNQLIEKDQLSFNLKDNTLKYIGGVDISFVKDNQEDACACLVVLEYPTMKIVYQDIEFIKLELPYIPGFLAFRETPFLIQLIDRLKQSQDNSKFLPQVIIVDGNGILHPRSFGLASHLGVLIDIPTIGIGKTFFHVDGLNAKDVKKQVELSCHKGGDFIELKGESGKVWGLALQSNDDSKNPIYVSIGHRISLETSLEIIKTTTKYRVPEPVRQADLKSREFIRLHFNNTTSSSNSNSSSK
ncbi:hypothetical protein CYY_006546 [Polysphondylium violaceum]|uniref:Endonuclease V n=1 Tax=Polysphondylium violaceum TaxID=133409 RepID=A0A8J4PRQ2_9MYCE|nr:hypothetical protein CYY_006546 [Polysphondylium violaceum]